MILRGTAMITGEKWRTNREIGGHEDIRQAELIMELLEQVNNLRESRRERRPARQQH